MTPPVSRPDEQNQPTPSPATERGWVEAARGGDQAAFTSLVEAYGGLVYRVIGRLVRDPDDRDDLVQETFYRACKGLARFRPESPFRPWLLTIALNAARDHLRSRQRWSSVSLDDPDQGAERAPELHARGPAPDELAVAGDLEGRVEQAWQRLDESAQTVLWLRVREELSYAEIATVLGVAVGTVMSRLSRARRALRDELQAVADAAAADPETRRRP